MPIIYIYIYIYLYIYINSVKFRDTMSTTNPNRLFQLNKNDVHFNVYVQMSA